jgi:hypothetical protein
MCDQELNVCVLGSHLHLRPQFYGFSDSSVKVTYLEEEKNTTAAVEVEVEVTADGTVAAEASPVADDDADDDADDADDADDDEDPGPDEL